MVLLGNCCHKYVARNARVVAAVAALLFWTPIVACSSVSRGAAVSASTSTAATVSAVSDVRPTDGNDYLVCPGIPESSLKEMFGEEVALSTESSWRGTSCRASIENVTVFRSRFGFAREGEGPWDVPFVAHGPTTSEFSFSGVNGVGEAQIYNGTPRGHGTTAFTCDDHYLVMMVSDAKYMQGDLLSNLRVMTQNSLPWLCQGQPVPGLGMTMEEVRPPWASGSSSSVRPSG